MKLPPIVIPTKREDVLLQHGFAQELLSAGKSLEESQKELHRRVVGLGLLSLTEEEVNKAAITWLDKVATPVYIDRIMNPMQEQSQIFLSWMSPMDHIRAILAVLPDSLQNI